MAADWVIDIGPEGGGEIMAAGAPEAAATSAARHTGRYLADMLKPRRRDAA